MPLAKSARRKCHLCRTPIPTSTSHFCESCKDIWLRVQKSAIKGVGQKVMFGKLPRVSTLLCIDCGRQAEHYDHRDYSKPSEVEPTCRHCNFKRGLAIVSKFKQIMAKYEAAR